MKKFLLIISLIILPFFSGCGSAAVCAFNLAQAFNTAGVNLWACSGIGVLGGFTIFSDGTGEALGATTGFPIEDTFTWQDAGCAEITTVGFNFAIGVGFTAEEVNLDGSIASGTLSFTHIEDGVSTDVSCTLITL